MKYLDKDSELVLQAIIDLENMGYIAYPDFLNALTKGKYKDNNDLVRILTSLYPDYAFGTVGPN